MKTKKLLLAVSFFLIVTFLLPTFSFAQGTWTQKANFSGMGRCDAVGFSIGTKGYIGTGAIGFTTEAQDFWEYNPSTTGINENNMRNYISVYPNPFNSSTTIQFNSTINNGELNIFNLYGQKIKTINNITGNKIKIDRDNLPSGIYFIRLTQDNKTITTDKLIITD